MDKCWICMALFFSGCLLLSVGAVSPVDTSNNVPANKVVDSSSSSDSAESVSVESNETSVESGEVEFKPLDTNQFRNPPRPIQRPVYSQGRRPSRPIHRPSLTVATIADLPFKSDEFRHQVFDFTPNQADPKTFSADCAAPVNPFVFQKPGYLVGLWDDKDGFANIDKAKCLRGGDEDDDDEPDDDLDDDHDDDDVFFELDPNQSELIDLNPKSPAHKPSCPIGFLLTGLTKTASDFDTAVVTTGHCLKLIRGQVEYDVCEQIATGDKNGGAFEPYVDWGVECQFGHAAVGLKVDGKRLRSLRCCKVTRTRLL